MIAGLKSYLETVSWDATVPLIIASVITVVITIVFRVSTASKLPTLNPKGALELSDRRVKLRFRRDASKLLCDWFAKNPSKPVVINGDMGPLTVLPPTMANEIRNDPRLSFVEVSQEAFHSHLHGFEPWALGQGGHLVEPFVRKDLAGQLGKQLLRRHMSREATNNEGIVKVTAPLADETSLGLSDLLTDSSEWHEANVRDTILQLVARISSRVFLGKELCRNPDWLRVSKEYTVASVTAAQELRQWPYLLRPIVNRFLSSCLTAQAMLKEARAIITPIIQKRYAARGTAAAGGLAYMKSNDSIDWFASADPKKFFDAAIFQLALSFVAIHTTTDLLSETLLRIAMNPEVIPDLREEIISVYHSDGWEKTALYKMKLLDSTIKETQRIKPPTQISMVRMVKESFTLSDGTVLRKGDKLGVTCTHLRDASNHKNPNIWDPYRFVRMRDDPVRQKAAHLVSTTPEHNGFGYGQHACPGRFFAANEIKIALIGILIKYDFKLPKDANPKVYENGVRLVSDPMATLKFRRREAEINHNIE